MPRCWFTDRPTARPFRGIWDPASVWRPGRPMVNGGTVVSVHDPSGKAVDAMAYAEEDLGGGGRPLRRIDPEGCGAAINQRLWSPGDPFDALGGTQPPPAGPHQPSHERQCGFLLNASCTDGLVPSSGTSGGRPIPCPDSNRRCPSAVSRSIFTGRRTPPWRLFGMSA